ncbi:hypothetical protein OVA03_10965 [Asticcacaulis sp. SL142]|uniref:hypothetical protein n=1 Tax=Asticcacaulis sp. SL142 TaxID=2995155 RepID=UPI00226C8F4B|nr:hypothetical protein [Asticcacaulis sp. SL142]WAC47225.1 hypothetical protein OVA03_10965 [Asticcacaulis sp. SL142]
MMKQCLIVCLSALVLASTLATSATAEDFITGWRVAKIKLFDKEGKFIDNVDIKEDLKLQKDKRRLPHLQAQVVDRAEPALLGIKNNDDKTIYVMQAQVMWTGSVCPTGYVTAAVASGQQNAGHNAGSSSGSGGCKPSTGGPR